MIDCIDIILDLVNGDCGKREISYQLSKRKEYTHCMRVNGGSNSGGNVHYLDKDGVEKHFILHQVPTGIFHGKKCIIGSGCVVDLNKLCKEIQDLEKIGISVKDKLFIANNAHLITQNHLDEESNETKIGTTKAGVGPCYRDKYNRTGMRIKGLFDNIYVNSTMHETDEFINYETFFKKYNIQLIDLYEYLYDSHESIRLLVEMAQGFYLDIDHGDYPFVTSSHTTVAGALLNLLPWNKLRKVYGVCKAYDTYVGSKIFQPKDEVFNELQTLGKEFGATTGRKRQCNWLNIAALNKAIDVNCVTHLVVSKIDVLDSLNKNHKNNFWKVIGANSHTYGFNNMTFSFENIDGFKEGVKELINKKDVVIQFRDSPSCPMEI